MKKIFGKKTILYAGGIVVVAGIACAVCWCCCARGVGVVNMARVKNEAGVYRDIIAQQNKYETELQQRMRAEFEKLQRADKELTAQRAKLSDEAFRKKAAALQKQVAELQARLQTEMQQISFASQIAVSQAQKDIEAVAKKVMRKKGMSVLIDAAPVVYAKEKTDVTAAFIKGLNAAKIAVNYPDPKLIQLERK